MVPLAFHASVTLGVPALALQLTCHFLLLLPPFARLPHFRPPVPRPEASRLNLLHQGPQLLLLRLLLLLVLQHRFSLRRLPLHLSHPFHLARSPRWMLPCVIVQCAHQPLLHILVRGWQMVLSMPHTCKLCQRAHLYENVATKSTQICIGARRCAGE